MDNLYLHHPSTESDWFLWTIWFNATLHKPQVNSTFLIFHSHILFVIDSVFIITNSNFHYINMCLYFMKVQLCIYEYDYKLHLVVFYIVFRYRENCILNFYDLQNAFMVLQWCTYSELTTFNIVGLLVSMIWYNYSCCFSLEFIMFTVSRVFYTIKILCVTLT